MTAPSLSENDAALYRLYAVGMLTYDEALRQADNESRLRRVMLHFDHVSAVGNESVTAKPRTPQEPARAK